MRSENIKEKQVETVKRGLRELEDKARGLTALDRHDTEPEGALRAWH